MIAVKFLRLVDWTPDYQSALIRGALNAALAALVRKRMQGTPHYLKSPERSLHASKICHIVDDAKSPSTDLWWISVDRMISFSSWERSRPCSSRSTRSLQRSLNCSSLPENNAAVLTSSSHTSTSRSRLLDGSILPSWSKASHALGRLAWFGMVNMRIHLPRMRSELTALKDWLPPLTWIDKVEKLAHFFKASWLLLKLPERLLESCLAWDAHCRLRVVYGRS